MPDAEFSQALEDFATALEDLQQTIGTQPDLTTLVGHPSGSASSATRPSRGRTAVAGGRRGPAARAPALVWALWCPVHP